MAHDPDAIAEATVGLIALLIARLDRLGVASIAEIRKGFEPIPETPQNPAVAQMLRELVDYLSAMERARTPRSVLELIQGGRPEGSQGEEGPTRPEDESA